MSLGQIIRSLRKEKKITQEQLGKVLNVRKSTISQYENDINKPDTDMLKLIADYFNVSVDYLLGRTNSKDTLNNKKDMPTKAYHNLDKSGLSEEDIEKVVERQFYIVLWQKYYDGVEEDLIKRAKDFIRRFESCGVPCTLLKEG
ncbi:helix-turn-helix domain-containing protein, partial [Alkaliphilus pronyensis]